MTYLEEILARDLYKDLWQKFSNQSQCIECYVQGGGVHWQCVVKRYMRDCVIDCFNEFESAEYYICFRQNLQKVAERRTRLKSEVINSVQNWIAVGDLSQLHDFLPIDGEKRKLIAIGNDLTAISKRLVPYLELDKYLADSYSLWFENIIADRNVCISVDYDNSRENLYAVFRGESRKSSVLFSCKNESFSCLAKVIEKWVVDLVMPSAIKADFSWIKMEDLADYYEHGNLLEGEFVKSWDHIVSFYDNIRFYKGDQFVELMIDFIESMKNEGYNHYVHAEQAHHLLILRRGNRDLSFVPECDGYEANDQQKIFQSLKVSYRVNGILVGDFEEDKITLTNRIRILLNKLSEITIS